MGPEIIITQDENAYQQIMQDSVWKSIQAVKNNKVLLFKGTIWLVRWSSGDQPFNGMRRLQSHFDARIEKRPKICKLACSFYHPQLKC